MNAVLRYVTAEKSARWDVWQLCDQTARVSPQCVSEVCCWQETFRSRRNFCRFLRCGFLLDDGFGERRHDESSTPARSSHRRADYCFTGYDPARIDRKQSPLLQRSCCARETTCGVIAVRIGIRAARRRGRAASARGSSPRLSPVDRSPVDAASGGMRLHKLL